MMKVVMMILLLELNRYERLSLSIVLFIANGLNRSWNSLWSDNIIHFWDISQVLYRIVVMLMMLVIIVIENITNTELLRHLRLI